MFLFCRTIVDDILFSVSQITERNVSAHAHFPADISHQRPHQRIPRSNGAFIDGKRVVRYKGGAVYSPYHPGTVAGTACALTVERQLFSRRSVEMRAAVRAYQFLSGSYGEGGSQIVPVGTSVLCQSGEHQAQAV